MEVLKKLLVVIRENIFYFNKKKNRVCFDGKKWNWFWVVGHISGTSQKQVGDIELKERLAFEHAKMENNFNPEMLTGEAQGGKSSEVSKK